MKFIPLILSCSLLAACTDSSKKESTSGNTDSTVVPVNITDPVNRELCFEQQNMNDTFRLSFKQEDDKVTGTLIYLFKEKDSNRGQLLGNMNGDTLIADYTFHAEGISSVRQVAFLIKNEKATEGYADLEQKDGKLVFKDVSAISFEKGLVMTKAACK